MKKGAAEIGYTVDAVDGGIGIEIDHRDIQYRDLPGLGIVTATDEKALIFVAEVVAKDAFYPGALLFDHQFGQVVIMYAGQFHVCTTEPGAGDGLGPGEQR